MVLSTHLYNILWLEGNFYWEETVYGTNFIKKSISMTYEFSSYFSNPNISQKKKILILVATPSVAETLSDRLLMYLRNPNGCVIKENTTLSDIYLHLIMLISGYHGKIHVFIIKIAKLKLLNKLCTVNFIFSPCISSRIGFSTHSFRNSGMWF